jgi:putative ABC transport system substrate-binding protein
MDPARRWFVTRLPIAMLFAPIAVEAQPGKVYRLGILGPGGRPAPGTSSGHVLLIEILRELGYVEGQNLVVERRYAEGKTDRLPELARELAHIPVDVIVAVSSAVDTATDRAADGIRIRGKPQDREGAESHDPAVLAPAR